MITQLWDLLPHPSSEHVVRLFARGPQGAMTGDFARSPGELQRFVDFIEGSMNIYVGLNPTKSTAGIRHSASEVTHWSFVIFDIDPVEDNADPRGAADIVLSRLCGLFGRDLIEKHKPTIIDSGRGIQLWFRGEDIEFTETSIDRTKVRKIMSYWLTNLSKRLGVIEGCKLDTSVSDLPRVTRLPGSINLKTGRMATILQAQEKPFTWLFPFLINYTPIDIFVERPLVKRIGQPWWVVFNLLTVSAKEYLLRGKAEPGRHKVAFHTAKSFAELGISKNEAWKAIKNANKLAGEDETLPLDQLGHCLEEGYKNGL